MDFLDADPDTPSLTGMVTAEHLREDILMSVLAAGSRHGPPTPPQNGSRDSEKTF
ncbi:hypothetical protein RvY_14325 [Ramazzottius varieornatus]|uniref:Uncharacterized protein n=1 Tax=Ramazzottius varieornatus TaxID=947166 RepID=A0A1D1VQY1_RAMVA|nr:hypothetical protein RvY_14325 [Ramazzottius varieornatus]